MCLPACLPHSLVVLLVTALLRIVRHLVLVTALGGRPAMAGGIDVGGSWQKVSHRRRFQRANRLAPPRGMLTAYRAKVKPRAAKA